MKKSIFLLPFIFIISSCGGGGGGGGSTPTPTTPTPTVNLSADPVSVLLENTSTLTWSSTNATSCSASWTNQTGSSGSEAVTISTAGNNSFSITCTGAGGSRSATVTVEGYRNTDGVVVDGYISGAEVCIDEDENWTCDTNESSTTSDNDGKFTIKYANGNLVSIGGTDLDSQTLLDNLLITHKLTGHSDFKAVTPVTSVATFMTDATLINSVLGIDETIDVSSFDPVANKGDGGVNDYLYEKGNQLTVLAYALQNITNNLNTTTETTQDYFKAITEEIEKEYTETETKVDIETEQFIAKVIDNVIEVKSVTIDETAKANTTKVLSGMLPIIQVKSSDDLTTSVIRFAVSTLQTDIKAIANGTASAEMVISYTGDILNYIAEDQNLDSSEIAPDISAIDDFVLTSEDVALEINTLLNDSYVTSSPFSLSATNGTNGSTSISNNLITYSSDADYNGSDSFSYTITQGDKTSSANVTVTIDAVNDAPTIDIASTIQVQENQTAVTTISVSDVDEDDLTLTLSGTDADSFDLSTDNVLTFKEAPDFETKSSYSITLTLTDGTETATKDVIITIIDINDAAPVITSDATFSAEENQTAIGTVTATDAEGDDITFAVSGDELSITSAGVLSFVTAPDYETKSIYTATVTVKDTEDNSSIQDITVNITNINDVAPEFTSEATFNAEENQTAIGTVTATDAEGDDITFAVSGDELSITSAGVLSFVTAPDYEIKTSYTATVTANDGFNNADQDIIINVTDVIDNDGNPPVLSNLTASPSTVDVTSEAATITLSIGVTDESGVDITQFLSKPQLNKTGSPTITANANWALVSGDDKDGTYEATVTVPTTTAAGDYSINSGFIYDIYENQAGTVTDEGAANGGVTINSSRESNPPVLSNLTASPSTVDVTSEAATITLSIGVTDESGVDITQFLSKPQLNKTGSPTITANANWALVSGDDKDGTYEATVTVPTTTAAGDYSINSGFIYDIYENQAGTVTDEGAANGGVTITTNSSSETIYYLYGDSSQSTYLGCYGCGSSNTESICNESGTYGSSVGVSSIWNTVGTYGSTVGTNSPWNSVGTNPPEFFNNKDKTSSYGKFTINTVTANRTNITKLTNVLDFFNNTNDNHSATRNYACSVSETSINVTVAPNNNGSGNVYVINGVQKPSLTLERGKSYTFEHPSGHPFRFSNTSDGTHGFGLEYTDDVAKSNGSTTIAVGSSTPTTLYYYCSIHSGMGGSISIN